MRYEVTIRSTEKQMMSSLYRGIDEAATLQAAKLAAEVIRVTGGTGAITVYAGSADSVAHQWVYEFGRLMESREAEPK